MICEGQTGAGVQCSRRANEGSKYCKTHERLNSFPEKEAQVKTSLESELDNCSCSEICNLVYNSTQGRVALDPGLPHDCLKAQAIEHLNQ